MKILIRNLLLLKIRFGNVIGTVLIVTCITLYVVQFLTGRIIRHTYEESKIIRIDYNPSSKFEDSYFKINLENGNEIDVSQLGNYSIGDIYEYKLSHIVGRKSLRNDTIVRIIGILISLTALWLYLPVGIFYINNKFYYITTGNNSIKDYLRASNRTNVVFDISSKYSTFSSWQEINRALEDCYDYLNSLKNNELRKK